MDTLYISEELRNFIFFALKENLPELDDQNLWTFASHTHYAPSLEEHRHALTMKDAEYVSFIKEKIFCLINEVIQEKAIDVLLKVVKKKTKRITIGRRRRVRLGKSWVRWQVLLQPSLFKNKREEATIIKILSCKTGKPICAMWNFPCHPTNLINLNSISSAFPGFIRSTIRDIASNSELPIIFMQGFSGDIYPRNPGPFPLRHYLNKFKFLPYDIRHINWKREESYKNWEQNLSQQIVKIWHTKEITLENNISSKEISTPIKALLGISPVGIEKIRFKKLSIGELIIVGISAEVVSPYLKILQKKHPLLIGVGCVDVSFGYLPTQKQVKEGGYESAGFFDSFLVSGEFSEKFQEKTITCINQLISQ